MLSRFRYAVGQLGGRKNMTERESANQNGEVLIDSGAVGST